MDHQKPKVNEKMAAKIAQDIFGLSNITEVKELMSNYDRNFQIKTTPANNTSADSNSNKFVLKLLNSIDSQHPQCILAETEAMEFLRSKGFPCPKVFPVKKDKSEHMAFVELGSNETHLVRLMNFLGGTTAANINRNPELLYKIGTFVGAISKQLKDFSHAGIKLRSSQGFKWNLLEFLDIEKYICACKDVEEIKLIHQVHETFMNKVKPQLKSFRSGTVHNDLNSENILVSHPPYSLTGVIDFGDMLESILISELSNSMASFMEGDCGIEYSGYFLAGYQSVFPLPDNEYELLYYFVAARLCQLVMYSRSNLNQDPSQANIQARLQKYYGTLVKFWRKNKEEVEEIWSQISTNINAC